MKDPAFLFYSADFIVGTIDLTFEQKGRYIQLLCLQHTKGPIRPALFLSISGNDPLILEKFKQDDAGNFYNERLKEETDKRRKFSESRRKNLKQYQDKQPTSDTDTGNPYREPISDPDKGGHMVGHMENENINENINKDEVKNEEENEEEIQVVGIIKSSDEEEEKFLEGQDADLVNFWRKWIDYKKAEHKFKYKSIKTESAAFFSLMERAAGNPTKAIAIIKQSISNGWKGFFDLKTNDYGQKTSNERLAEKAASVFSRIVESEE